MESEIKALDMMILRIIFVRNILQFLEQGDVQPTTVFIDNNAAVELCKTLKTNPKSKHIQLRINFVRECINSRIITLEWVASEENCADALTKPLPWKTMHKHMKRIMEGWNGDLSPITDVVKTSLNHIFTEN